MLRRTRLIQTRLKTRGCRPGARKARIRGECSPVIGGGVLQKIGNRSRHLCQAGLSENNGAEGGILCRFNAVESGINRIPFQIGLDALIFCIVCRNRKHRACRGCLGPPLYLTKHILASFRKPFALVRLVSPVSSWISTFSWKIPSLTKPGGKGKTVFVQVVLDLKLPDTSRGWDRRMHRPGPRPN